MIQPTLRDFQETKTLVSKWKRVALVSHIKADGDALGSLVAMGALLEKIGVQSTPIVFEEISQKYSLFRRNDSIVLWDDDTTPALLEACDGVIVLDTCSYAQLGPMVDWLRASSIPKLAVDHHITRDDLADSYLVNESAAATCLILYEWAMVTGWELSKEAREAVFVGIATDTGWFRHSNTDACVFSAIAKLAEGGVRPHELYEELYQRESIGRVRLLGEALGSLEMVAGDHVAVMTLPLAAFTRAGAVLADTEDIVNEPLRIDSVRVSVLLVEANPDLIRVSLRSKPPRSTDSCESSKPSRLLVVNVAEIARALGGGGHARAAGVSIRGNLASAHTTVVNRLQTIPPQ